MSSFNENLARTIIQQHLRIPESKPGPPPMKLKKERIMVAAVYFSCREKEWMENLLDYIKIFNASECYDGVIYCPNGTQFRHSGLTQAFRDIMLQEKGLERGDTFVDEDSDPKDVTVYWTWRIVTTDKRKDE
jgi:hypothetical protein